jgi:hypothetical protein
VRIHARERVAIGADVLVKVRVEAVVFERAGAAQLARDAARQLEEGAPHNGVAEGDESLADALCEGQLRVRPELEPLRRPWPAVPRRGKQRHSSRAQHALDLRQHLLRVRYVLERGPGEREANGAVAERQVLHVPLRCAASQRQQRHEGEVDPGVSRCDGGERARSAAELQARSGRLHPLEPFRRDLPLLRHLAPSPPRRIGGVEEAAAGGGGHVVVDFLGR